MRPRSYVVVTMLCFCFVVPASRAQDANAPVARVNGEPISQRELVNRLIADYGNDILEQLIAELLVAQEAQRLKIEVTEQEVDQRLRKVSSQLPPGVTLEEALRKQSPPMGITTYRELTRMFLRLEKMVVKEVEASVTDRDVLQFRLKRPDLAEQPEQVKVEALVAHDQQLADRLYQEATRRNPDFDKLAQANTQGDQRVEYVALGWQPIGRVPDIPPAARKGLVTKPQQAAPGVFWIYRVVDRQPGRRKKEDEAMRDARAALVEFLIAEKATLRLQQIREQNKSRIEKTLPKGN